MPTGVYKRKQEAWTIETKRLYARIWTRINYAKKRVIVLNNFGGKCIRCGFGNLDALELDHIEPVKRKYGESISGTKTIDNLYSGKASYSDFQMLCANCHSLKTKNEDKIKFKNLITEDLERNLPTGWKTLYE